MATVFAMILPGGAALDDGDWVATGLCDGAGLCVGACVGPADGNDELVGEGV